MQEEKREKMISNDHDLLIEVITKLDYVMDNFKDLKDNVLDRVNKLESDKSDVCDFSSFAAERREKWASYDKRLDKIENWRTSIITIMGVAGVLASLVTYIYFIRYDIMKNNVADVKMLLEKHVSETR